MKKLKALILNLLRVKRKVIRTRKREVGKIKLGVEFVSGEFAEYLLHGNEYEDAEYRAATFIHDFVYGRHKTIDNIYYNPEVFIPKKTVVVAHVSHKVNEKYTARVKY